MSVYKMSVCNGTTYYTTVKQRHSQKPLIYREKPRTWSDEKLSGPNVSMQHLRKKERKEIPYWYVAAVQQIYIAHAARRTPHAQGALSFSVLSLYSLSLF